MTQLKFLETSKVLHDYKFYFAYSRVFCLSESEVQTASQFMEVMVKNRVFWEHFPAKKLLLILFCFSFYNLAFALNLLEQISYTPVNMQKSSVLLSTLEKRVCNWKLLHRNTQINTQVEWNYTFHLSANIFLFQNLYRLLLINPISTFFMLTLTFDFLTSIAQSLCSIINFDIECLKPIFHSKIRHFQ